MTRSAPNARTVIRVCLIGISVLILLLATIIFAAWLGRNKLKREVQSELSTLQARHVIYRLEDLPASYRTPNPDATALYLEAFSKFKPPVLNSVELDQLFKESRPVGFPRADDELKAALAETARENQEFVVKLRQANAIMACRYPVDFTNGMHTLLKHCLDIRESTKLLRALGWNSVLVGRNDEAMAYVLDILRMSKSLETEPILISQVVRGNCLHMSASVLEVIFSKGTPQLAELDSVQQVLERFELKKMMIRSLAFDRCILVDTLTGSLQKKWDIINFDKSTQGAEETMALIGLWKIEQQGIHERDLLIALDLLGKIERAIDSDDIVAKLDRVDAELAGYKVLIKDSVPPIIPAMLLPGMVKGLKQLAEAQAMKTVLQTAIAIQRYQLAEGHLPGDLSRLVPKYLPVLPVDPFISKPLTYCLTESGYLLYSVGKDLKDDQGRRFSSNKENTYDLVFEVRSAVR